MDIDQLLVWQGAWIVVSHRYLIPVTKRQPEGNADALYAFKSRGFGAEIGIVTLPV